MSRVAVGWGENTVGQSAPSEPAACFVGGRISERVEKKRGSHGPGFRVAGPSGGSGSVEGEARWRRHARGEGGSELRLLVKVYSLKRKSRVALR